MLQIASGKFFAREPGQRNELRGVLHTNLILLEPVETVAGRLLPASAVGNTKALVYELTELIEAPLGVGVVALHCIDPYLNEFAAILSFALNITCTPDPELADRLIRGRTGPAVHVAPGKFIARAFDRVVVCQDEDAARLVKMAADLMGLERKSHLAAIRAIHTYVTGLHRLADDLPLAYTLLVASIESLVQGFDGHVPEWEDYEEAKRGRIDDALKDADEETARSVREALLEIEHVSLRRRFCDFAIKHLEPSYFREEASEQENPIGRGELPGALSSAYGLRSRYVHNLNELPRQLTMGTRWGETFRIGDETLLTFQGLTRLARHVITQFISRQPKVETELYDYSQERSGIVQLKMAPQYWIHRVEDLSATSGRGRLEGFLEQLAAHLQQEPDAVITDIRPMLAKVEEILPGTNSAHRRPFLALYLVFNAHLPPDMRMRGFAKIKSRYVRDLESPSIEALLVHLMVGSGPEWPLAEHQEVHDAYFRAQGKRSGIKMPHTLEAGLCLLLAERNRIAGDPKKASDLVALAVENYPGYGPLYEFERTFDSRTPIDWRRIIFPEPKTRDSM